MGGCPETVKPQPFAFPDAAPAKCPIPDDACAEKGRGLMGGETGGEGIDEGFRGDDRLCVAPINIVTGKTWILAEVFISPLAVRACAAGGIKPGHADPISDLKPSRPWPQTGDLPHHLMARNHRDAMNRQLPFDHMEIGAADGANLHMNQYLPRSGFR
jgi:hypothetical protein